MKAHNLRPRTQRVETRLASSLRCGRQAPLASASGRRGAPTANHPVIEERSPVAIAAAAEGSA